MERIRRKIGIMLLAAAAVVLSCGSAMAGWEITDLGAALTPTGAHISGEGTGIWGNSINNNGIFVFEPGVACLLVRAGQKLISP